MRPCQEENENVGQNSHISEPSSFWFPVYEGLFEHSPIIRDAVWLFMWLIARTTLEPNGRGKVLGGIPISDERPAGELGFPLKTVRRWRRMLLAGGYIEAVRTPYGFKYTLLRSKKWRGQLKRDFPKLPISTIENGQIGHSDRPNRAQRVPAAATLIKTTQRQYKEEAEEATAWLLGRKSKEVSKEAWEAVGIELCGVLKFTSAWERIHSEQPEGEQLSGTMERCIQCCQQGRIPVPRPFYEAKRRVEEQEAEDRDWPTHPIPDHDTVSAEFNARKQAEAAKFNALPPEEKLVILKGLLGTVEDLIMSAKNKGKEPRKWMLDYKADLDHQISECLSSSAFQKPLENVAV